MCGGQLPPHCGDSHHFADHHAATERCHQRVFKCILQRIFKLVFQRCFERNPQRRSHQRPQRNPQRRHNGGY